MSAPTRRAWDGESAPGVRVVRRATIVAMAIGVVATIVAFPSLPQLVPTHFGLSGEADAMGPRWSVLVLAAVWAGLQLLVAWLSLHPEWGTVPVEVTASNAQHVHREVERMLVLLGAALAVVFAGILLAVVGLPGMPVVALGLAAVLGVAALGVVRIVRAA